MTDKHLAELEKAGLYDALVHLHRQEHTNDGCFCTTEMSGAYSKILEIFATALAQQDRESQYILISRLRTWARALKVKHALGKDGQSALHEYVAAELARLTKEAAPEEEKR